MKKFSDMKKELDPYFRKDTGWIKTCKAGNLENYISGLIAVIETHQQIQSQDTKNENGDSEDTKMVPVLGHREPPPADQLIKKKEPLEEGYKSDKKCKEPGVSTVNETHQQIKSQPEHMEIQILNQRMQQTKMQILMT